MRELTASKVNKNDKNEIDVVVCGCVLRELADGSELSLGRDGACRRLRDGGSEFHAWRSNSARRHSYTPCWYGNSARRDRYTPCWYGYAPRRYSGTASGFCSSPSRHDAGGNTTKS